MMGAAESKMDEAGLQDKHGECAVFYGRRSGSSWHKGKENAAPELEIKSDRLPVYNRDKPYKQLVNCIGAGAVRRNYGSCEAIQDIF